MTESLPEGYEDLEPFVARWSVSGASERAALHSCSCEERLAFYEAVKGRIDAALAELERKPLGELDARERRLLNLMLSYAHLAPAVEAD